MKYILETARLRLREFNFDDCSFIIELLNTPGWLKFIGNRNVRTIDQAKKYLENGPLTSYKTVGYGLSMVERKEDGMPVGMCGILNRDTLQHPDIGFAFLPEHTGKGYAMEIVVATLLYANEKIGISEITAIVQPTNTKSISLLEKTGFSFQNVFSFPGSGEVLSLYRRSI